LSPQRIKEQKENNHHNSLNPNFHLARHVSTRSTCRAHAFWLCRACQTAQLNILDTTS